MSKASPRRSIVVGGKQGPRLRPFRDAQWEVQMSTTDFAANLGIARQTLNARWVTDDCTLSIAEQMAAVLGKKFVFTYVLVFTLRLLGSSFSELSEVLSPSLKSLFCLK